MNHPKDADTGAPAPPTDLKIIDSPAAILDLLEKMLLGEENVEIQLNDRTRVFFTQFLDHLPELLEIPNPTTGEITYREPPYRSCFYLRDKDHLLIAPLEPPIGNAHIRSSEGVTFRFFQGVNAVEGEVAFQKVLAVRGEPAIQIGYPANFRVYRKRRHFRADVTMGVQVMVRAMRPGLKKEGRLFDISAGGASFEILPEDRDKYPLGEMLTLTVLQDEDESFQVKGYIRNVYDAPVSTGGRRRVKRLLCGVQFDLPDSRTAMRIDELVAGIQREKLSRVMARQRAARAELNAEEETNSGDGRTSRNRFQEELSRFFTYKKDNENKIR